MSFSKTKIKIGLYSTNEIRSMSSGEICNSKTFTLDSHTPYEGGLFCENVFGPIDDYYNLDYTLINAIFGAENTMDLIYVDLNIKKHKNVIGHIELASPIIHPRYKQFLSYIFDISRKDFYDLLNFYSYIVLDPGDSSLMYKTILSFNEYWDKYYKYDDRFKALTGPEAVRCLLRNVDLIAQRLFLKKKLLSSTERNKTMIEETIEMINLLIHRDCSITSVILDVIPVIPPTLRPYVFFDKYRSIASTINDSYKAIIENNNRLKRQYAQAAPCLITIPLIRNLQKAVDDFFRQLETIGQSQEQKNAILKKLSDDLSEKNRYYINGKNNV